LIDLEEALDAIAAAGLLRELRTVESAPGPRVRLDGHDVLLLCSNDYLGLAEDPRVCAAAAQAALTWGAGSGSSRLVSGSLTLHRELEAELAAFKGTEACVLFGSGFLANVGVVASLAGVGGVVFSDALNHASLIDGCRLAAAETRVYPHSDVEALGAMLTKTGKRPATIVTESVFSMDGDAAPLAEIVDLAQEHDARVIVDEAHATGVVGPGGRGLVAALGLEGRIDVIIGTLSKALGSYGAFVCCSPTVAMFLINRARTLIFSTALPPASVAAAREALRIIRDEPAIVDRLRANARTLRIALAREGLDVTPGEIPIVPLIVGDPADAMAVCETSLAAGVFAQAIRPPTVPAGTARLRVVTMASHTEEDLRSAAATLGEAVHASGSQAAVRQRLPPKPA